MEILEEEISEDNPQILSNTDRLRLHLSKEGLAKNLLDAWLLGSKADAQKRMLNAINKFHDKKQEENEPATATEN
ncbi:MAG: hypothetical protein KBC91_01320 [Candidatus Omnitrophica bacterium]|jgi:hypothetical protein|nr:hypothetical protein [Candidatus Omnitrophota bacterium]